MFTITQQSSIIIDSSRIESPQNLKILQKTRITVSGLGHKRGKPKKSSQTSRPDTVTDAISVQRNNVRINECMEIDREAPSREENNDGGELNNNVDSEHEPQSEPLDKTNGEDITRTEPEEVPMNLNENDEEPEEDVAPEETLEDESKPEETTSVVNIPKINVPDEESGSERTIVTETGDAPKTRLHLHTSEVEALSLRSMSEGDNSVFSDGAPDAPDSDEVDDIELIFTTDATKEEPGLEEDLVSIHERPNDDEDVFDELPCTAILKTTPLYQTRKSSGSFGADYGSSSFENKSMERDGSFDQLDKRLHSIWSKCSVLIETDISKCGVLEEESLSSVQNRRNTCPNPLAHYRPIIARDKPKYNVRSTKIRPIHNQIDAKAKLEAAAQTDITALPWKSESYLAHKIATNFTTLPSKFALPIAEKCEPQPKMKLSDKTQEARRILLSDINFTSMVPELSRSADHLFQDGDAQDALHTLENAALQTCTRGTFLRTPDYFRNNTIDVPDGSMSPNYGKYYTPHDYGFGSNRLDIGKYRSSVMSMTSPMTCECYALGGMNRGSFWKYSSPLSFESTTSYKGRPVYGSVPTSPTRQHRSRSVPHVPRTFMHGYPSGIGSNSRYNFTKFYSRPTSQWGFGQKNKTRSRVMFEDSTYRYHSRINNSLPDLRSDSWDSPGDSTDSLVEEADRYLRRSVDCIKDHWKPDGGRRGSAPNPVRETDPPLGSTPYLPRSGRDLRVGHWVKVITKEGRVRGGRVKHVLEMHDVKGHYTVGVELPTATGNSDGTYNGSRFFNCEKNHAIFVPFNKVIMAWST